MAEVAEIAEASGTVFQSADLASAFKSMMLRYLQEQGADTAQIQEAINQITPEQFDVINEEVQKTGAAIKEGGAPEQGQPPPGAQPQPPTEAPAQEMPI